MANIVPDGGISQTPIRATFQYGNEPSVIYYTLDGSTPTTYFATWEAKGPRQPGQVFLFDESVSPLTLKWIAKDIKGNISDVRSARLRRRRDAADAGADRLAQPGAAPRRRHGQPECDGQQLGHRLGELRPDRYQQRGLQDRHLHGDGHGGQYGDCDGGVQRHLRLQRLLRAPVDNPPAFNVANAGQAVPLNWQIIDANGVPVTDLSSVKVSVTTLACDLGTTPDLAEETAAGKSGLQNLGDGYYQFNWKTPKTLC